MRVFALLGALVVVSGCLQAVNTETPDRAIRSFDGATVTIQSKTQTPNADDIALARSVCSGARYSTTNFVIEGVSEYLFIC